MTKGKMEKLKPCPFCKGEADYDNCETGYEWIECTNCGAKTQHLKINSYDKLVKAWNSRPTEEKLITALKQLDQMLVDRHKFRPDAPVRKFIKQTIKEIENETN